MHSVIYSHGVDLLQPVAVIRLQWTVADVVVKLRERRGWDRRQLATEARVSYATITRLEQGREMKAGSIAKVARAFGLNEAAIYALIPEGAPAADAEQQERDALWAQLSDASKSVVLSNLRQLAALAPAAATPTQTASPPPASPAIAAQKSRGTKRA